ncbi:MAG: hypothetical protein R3B48_08260 [Kofleriaceae bacterium]
MDETVQEAKGGGGGGGGGAPQIYLGFLDEQSNPASSIDTNIRAGQVDSRIFWSTGNPMPNNISVLSPPAGVALGQGGYTYPLGERRLDRPDGYRQPVVFNVPRSAIGSTISLTGSVTTDRGTVRKTEILTVVDAPTPPSGITIEKVGTELVVSWQPSQFGEGAIHYFVDNVDCPVPRFCTVTPIADTTDTSVTFTRSRSLLWLRAVADNADSSLVELDLTSF